MKPKTINEIIFFDYHPTDKCILSYSSPTVDNLLCKNIVETIIATSIEDDINQVLYGSKTGHVYYNQFHNKVFKTTLFVFNHKLIKGLIEDVTYINDYLLETKKALETKELFIEINQAILTMNHSEEIYTLILSKVSDYIGLATYGSILKLHPDGYFRFLAAVGYTQSNINNFELKLENSVGYRLTKGTYSKPIIYQLDSQDENSVILREDEKERFASSAGKNEIEEIIVAPIYTQGTLFGFISLDSTEKNIFSSLHIEIMTEISEQLSLVVERQLLFEEITRMSMHDTFTNLLNRSEQEVILKALFKEETSFSYVSIDLDGLKKINDTFGHQVGDKIIIDFAGKLKKLQNTYCIRTGGDEFAIIFKNKSYKESEIIMENLLGDVNNFNELHNDQWLKYSFSYGISEYPKDAQTYEDIMNISDFRMYENKKKKSK